MGCKPGGLPVMCLFNSLQSPRFTGVPTFARLPNVRTTEEVDLAIIGVPFDTGVSFRAGGRFGPNAIRAASVLIRGHNPVLDVHPFRVLSCVDYGDIAIVPGYIERSYEIIEHAVAPIVEAGVIPLLLGGDHSVTLPHLRATRSVGPVAVIDFELAHRRLGFLLRREVQPRHLDAPGDRGRLVDVDHSIEIGLRGSVYGPDDWPALKRELGLDYIPTHEVLTQSPQTTIEAIRRRVGGRPTFISFDIDVVDPAFAPGTGTPEAGGISSFQALQLIRGLRGIDFVGFDVVEVIPSYDSGEVTAILAANLGFEMISLSALRRLEGGTRPPSRTVST